MKLIDKDAVVAESNRLIAELVEEGESTMFEQGRISAFEDTKLFLDTLEVKEVDLDREIRRYRMNNPTIGHRAESLYDYITNIAKHFFELGMQVSNKAQKGE